MIRLMVLVTFATLVLCSCRPVEPTRYGELLFHLSDLGLQDGNHTLPGGGTLLSLERLDIQGSGARSANTTAIYEAIFGARTSKPGSSGMYLLKAYVIGGGPYDVGQFYTIANAREMSSASLVVTPIATPECTGDAVTQGLPNASEHCKEDIDCELLETTCGVIAERKGSAAAAYANSTHSAVDIPCSHVRDSDIAETIATCNNGTCVRQLNCSQCLTLNAKYKSLCAMGTPTVQPLCENLAACNC